MDKESKRKVGPKTDLEMGQRMKKEVKSFEFTGKEVKISSSQGSNGMEGIFPPFSSKISAPPSEGKSLGRKER